MNEPEIYAKLNTIFRAVLEIPSISLAPTSTADTIPGWDSVAHILLMATIEQEFGIKFHAAEMEELKNVDELVGLISDKLKRK